jgi:hypothetical protein
MPRPDRRDRDDDSDEDRPRKPRRRDDDEREDRPRRAVRRDDEPDDYDDVPADRPRKAKAKKGGDGFARVVPYRNGAALAAYYCGVFGLIPLAAPILSPIAFILGIIGFLKARKDPKARGTGHAIAGIVLGLLSVPLWIVLWFTVFKPMTDPT